MPRRSSSRTRSSPDVPQLPPVAMPSPPQQQEQHAHPVDGALPPGTLQLERLGRELKCPICLSLFRQAASLSCNHIFCNSCILQSIKRCLTCPICKVPTTRREVRAAPQMDSLVHIYKSMEVTAGVDLFASQNATLKIAGGSSPGPQRKRQKCKYRKPLLNITDDLEEARNTTNSIAPSVDLGHQFQGSLPAKKRVQVPRFASIRAGMGFDEADENDTSMSPVGKKSSSFGAKTNQGHTQVKSAKSAKSKSKQVTATNSLVAASKVKANILAECTSQRQNEDLESNCKSLELRKCGIQIKKSTTAMQFTEEKDDVVSDVMTVDDFGRPRLAPFFWLRENSEDIDDTQTQVQPTQLTQTQPSLQPTFSDLKDQDDDGVEHGKEVEKVASAEANDYDSDAFEWTQRSCSPELTCSPSKKHVNEKLLVVDLPMGNVVDIDATVKLPSLDSMEKVLPEKSHECYPSQTTQLPQEISVVATNPEAVQQLNKVSKFRSHRLESKARRCSTRLESLSKACADLDLGTSKREITAVVDDRRQKAYAVLKTQTQNHVIRPMTKKGHKQNEIIGSQVGQTRTTLNYYIGNKEKSTAGVVSQVIFGEGENTIANLTETATQAKDSTTGNDGCSSKSQILPQGEDVTKRKPTACVFCGASGDSELAGRMMHYRDGIPVDMEGDASTSILHVHKLCAEWAPDVYFVDDEAKNLLAEVARGQKIKCSKCGVKGAALGCCLKRCRKSFHYPCACALSCKWDHDNFIMLCPDHAACSFPQKQGNKSRARTLGGPVTHSRKQEDLAKCDTKSEFDSTKMSQKWLAGPASKWVLCGSALSLDEKEQLTSFVAITGATLAKGWNTNVTHVIAGSDKDGAARRTFKFLMATTEGKWILKVGWLAACTEAGKPVSEEPYEISLDIHGTVDGPKRGRSLVGAKAPKIFEGTEFYFVGDILPSYKADLQSLVVAAGGVVLHRKPVAIEAAGSVGQVQPIVVYSKDIPSNGVSENTEKIIEKRRSEAMCLAASVGARVAAHTWILDSIAACELQPLDFE